MTASRSIARSLQLLRPAAVTLSVGVYTSEREREFDAAEAELAAVLDRKPRGRSPRTAKR